MAEAEVVAHQDGAGFEFVHENVAHEVFGPEMGYAQVEWQDQNFVDAPLFDEARALFGRGEQARGTLGSHQLGGMRVERDSGGAPGFASCDFDYLPQDLLMPQVDAVKIADGDGAGSEIGGNFGEAAINHAGTSAMVISRPS